MAVDFHDREIGSGCSVDDFVHNSVGDTDSFVIGIGVAVMHDDDVPNNEYGLESGLFVVAEEERKPFVRGCTEMIPDSLIIGFGHDDPSH